MFDTQYKQTAVDKWESRKNLIKEYYDKNGFTGMTEGAILYGTF
jgi:hypothetical protein